MAAALSAAASVAAFSSAIFLAAAAAASAAALSSAIFLAAALSSAIFLAAAAASAAALSSAIFLAAAAAFSSAIFLAAAAFSAAGAELALRVLFLWSFCCFCRPVCLPPSTGLRCLRVLIIHNIQNGLRTLYMFGDQYNELKYRTHYQPCSLK